MSKPLDVIPEKSFNFRRYSRFEFRRYSLDVFPPPSIPSVMILSKKSFHTDSDKAFEFKFFAFVSHEKYAHSFPPQCEMPTIKQSRSSL